MFERLKKKINRSDEVPTASLLPDELHSIDSTVEELIDLLMSYDWKEIDDPKKRQFYIDDTRVQLMELLKQEIFLARVDEATRACRNWEKKPGVPATYLIERIDTLKKELAVTTPIEVK